MKSFLDSFPRSGRLSPDVSLGARSGGESCPSASAASPPRSNGDRSYCGVRACCDPGDVVWWCVAFFIYLCTRTGKFVTPSRLLFSPLLFFSSRCFGSSSSSSTSGPSLLMVGAATSGSFFTVGNFRVAVIVVAPISLWLRLIHDAAGASGCYRALVAL